MKTFIRAVLSALILATSLILTPAVTRGQIVTFPVILSNPTNSQSFGAPAAIYVHARMADTNPITEVQYFSGITNIGVITNAGVLVTNLTQGNPFPFTWSNVLAGAYSLTAVVSDSAGNMATSPPVNITVTNPIIRPAVYIYYPHNGESFLAPTNVNIYVRAVETPGMVATVQFFANSFSLGVVSNSSQVTVSNISSVPLYPLTWPNTPPGSYALRAIATDTNGNTSTSSVVNITVVTNQPPPPPVPFLVSFWYPTNGQTFAAPANVGVHALVTDSNVVKTMQYFANGSSIGTVSNLGNVLLTNSTQGSPFFLDWSNVPAGGYALLAVATDSAGNMATSPPVNITVTNPTSPIIRPYVYIYSPANGATFFTPTNVNIYARAFETTGMVATVQFLANSLSLGVVSNSSQVTVSNISSVPLYPLSWLNPPPGNYALRAIAMDTNGNTATSSVVNITVTNPPPPAPVPFLVSFWYPSNGQTFVAPANVGVHARVTDSNVVETVQYFANGGSIGTVTNTGGVLLTNTTSANPFFLDWSNVPAGGYALIAVATDSAGNMATSAPVNITVMNPPPPPPVPFVVSFWYPTNGQTFRAPANVGVHARVTDSNVVETVQYFANGSSIGIVTNLGGILLTNSTQGNPFYLAWKNVPAGGYTLLAVGTDSAGNTATSGPVNITVTSPPPPPPIPFVVSFWYPANGQMFTAPANVGVHARVTDSNVVETVQYFANGTSIGTVTNLGGVLLTNITTANPFFLDWSNVPAGDYALTAVATDSTGNTATSAPVTIFVLTNLPPYISIYAPDPVAIEGTNYISWYYPSNSATNYFTGTNTATFLVHRNTGTNTDLTVYYAIGGTASNGVDYALIPDSVVIPAGKSYALITILPMNDNDSGYRNYDNVVLSLLPPPVVSNTPPAYGIASPSQAGAVILEETFVPMTQPVIHSLADTSLHVSLPATNGMNYCLEISTDMITWLPVCTNTVLKGSAHFVDPSGASGPSLFYKIVPVATPAAY
jgi:hypothetical protein